MMDDYDVSTKLSSAYRDLSYAIAEMYGHKREYSQERKGCYPFISSTPRSVVAQIGCALEYLIERDGVNTYDSYGRYKFVDAGCGIGNIVMIAKQFHHIGIADGIESDPKLVRLARRIINADGYRPKPTIYQSDIRSIEFYDDYDIVYYYCPMCDYDIQREFERHIFKQLRNGKIVITHDGNLYHRRSFEGEIKIQNKALNRLFTRINRSVYVRKGR